jgi:hypothetical protein
MKNSLVLFVIVSGVLLTSITPLPKPDINPQLWSV